MRQGHLDSLGLIHVQLMFFCSGKVPARASQTFPSAHCWNVKHHSRLGPGIEVCFEFHSKSCNFSTFPFLQTELCHPTGSTWWKNLYWTMERKWEELDFAKDAGIQRPDSQLQWLWKPWALRGICVSFVVGNWCLKYPAKPDIVIWVNDSDASLGSPQ